jgi:hypothetical protein
MSSNSFSSDNSSQVSVLVTEKTMVPETIDIEKMAAAQLQTFRTVRKSLMLVFVSLL